MNITSKQIQIIHTIISKKKLEGQKDAIIEGASGGRTSSVAALIFDEAAQLIRYLNGLQSTPGPAPGDKSKMIAHIFAMAHEMGWIKTYHAVETVQGGKQIFVKKKDYSAVHEWVVKYGYLKKPLNKYSYTELPALVTAFKNMYEGRLKKL